MFLLLRFFSLQLFNDDVPSHAKDKKNYSSDDLGEDADPGGVGDEGKEEAHGLPEPVVGEGGLLVVGKEAAIEGVDLGLPDRVTNSPEGGKEVDDRQSACSWGPNQHHNDHCQVEGSPQDEDWKPWGTCHPPNQLDEETKTNRGGGVAHSKENEHPANCVNSIGAGYKALKIIQVNPTHRSIDFLWIVLTAVKSAPKKPCSIPDQKVMGMTRICSFFIICLNVATSSCTPVQSCKK